MIAVLGAGGRVGSAVLDELARRDARAFGVARRTFEAPLELRSADVLDRPSLRAALDGATRLLLIAPNGPQQAAYEAAALAAAEEARVERIVKVSGGSASLGPNGTTPTAVAHWCSEQAIERSGIAATFLRPAYFAQNLLERPAAVARATGLLPDPFGGAALAAVDVRDVTACAVAALIAPEPQLGAWRITGPRPVTMANVAHHLGLRRLPTRPSVAARALRRAGASGFEIDHALRMARLFSAGADAPVTDHVSRLTGIPARPVEALLDERRDAFTPSTGLARIVAGRRTARKA